MWTAIIIMYKYIQYICRRYIAISTHSKSYEAKQVKMSQPRENVQLMALIRNAKKSMQEI